ncbi:hypothetical protein EGI22_04590 [Lacihabitans sp. LS3-19]|uniref:hypothetical protein n=1 Tax=Lacihabitans sp. LS3-19 TaxID=2487335 RepID=UPI0020CE5222|nr:hypothetical protein [Lacihabitans sp. LS3-19]MCP9767176.1 hypothetical protein [Lacihabitans sp. LS3-19]
MKNLNRLLYFFVLSLLFFSCSKDEPEPILADMVSGEYVVDYYVVNNKKVTLPATNSSGETATGKISAYKVEDNVASFTFFFTLTKFGISSSSNSKLENVTLKKANSTDIEGFVGTEKVIEYSNNKLILTMTNEDPSKVLVIKGIKF